MVTLKLLNTLFATFSFLTWTSNTLSLKTIKVNVLSMLLILRQPKANILIYFQIHFDFRKLHQRQPLFKLLQMVLSH